MTTQPKIPITIAYGDGIGPEIMKATLGILEAAGAQIEPEVIDIGLKVYERGITSGIESKSWDSLLRTKIFLKAPITTPQGGGMKSLNVTVRGALGLYANIRPCRAYAPYVHTLHPNMDVVIVRENEEDVYTGIEHRQTQDVYQCLKLISRSGSERLIRYAFEYAVRNGRKKVTCVSKDNIMKMTDGIFHKIFSEIAVSYPQINTDHWIIDIGTAKLADAPEQFDVIVTSNLYGDILSDVAAEIVGSVGLAGSANIGTRCAMFEAIHGSAPDIAGKNMANPSGLLQGAVMMLVHIGQTDVAARVQNAWLKTLEDGVHTGDIAGPLTKEKVGTDGFTQAIIDRLGQKPQQFASAAFDPKRDSLRPPPEVRPTPAVKTLHGVDVFLDWKSGGPKDLARLVEPCAVGPLKLQMITNRGVKVWPDGFDQTVCVDHWRVRYMAENKAQIEHSNILQLLGALMNGGFDVVKTENLYHFDGQPGYSLGQGQ